MLFQPSNITPDEVNGSGCVDLTDGLAVSWQVNGDSAMTAWQINIYQNDAASTPVYSTGKTALTTPFWGVNYKGEQQFFTATLTAAALTAVGMSNGNEYKLVITQWWSAEDSVQQTTASVFLTRTAPVVGIAAIPSPLAERSYSFSGSYSQAEGDALRWVRWQIAESGNESNPFLDTGEIYGTGELQVDYEGFFTGTTYAVQMSVETENGIDASTGWVTFAVEYTVTEPEGNVTVCQITDSSAVSVQWDQVEAAQGYDIYRRNTSENVLHKIASVDDETGQIRDYGAASGNTYVYYVFPTGELAYLTEPMVSDEITVRLWMWAILETTENEDGSFSVVAVHFFSYGSGGVQEGTFSNNNSPTISKNFTQYPTRQAENANYLTGSVSGFIGTVDRQKNYSDTLAQAQALRALSTTDNTLFLLDPKGNFLRIQTSGEINVTIDHKNRAMPQTVTVPWVEIDSAENAAIVAAPGGDFYPVDQIIFTTVRLDPVSGILYWDRPVDYQDGSLLKLVAESSYIVTETGTASGEIASFETEIEWPLLSLTAQINPVQDLHGYDQPWPGGGGVNKWGGLELGRIAQDGTETASTDNWRGPRVDVGAATNLTLTIYSLPRTYSNGSIALWAFDSAGAGLGGATFFAGTGDISSFPATKTVNLPANTAYIRLRGYQGASLGGAAGIMDVVAQLELGSSATSFAPYENICPISGWTGVTAEQQGEKNLLEIYPASTNPVTVKGVTFTFNDDGTITANGTASDDLQFVIGAADLTAGTYLLSGTIGGSTATYYLGVVGTGSLPTVINTTGSTELTVSADQVAICRIHILNGTTVNDLVFYPMIRQASVVDPTFEPHTRKYPVSWQDEAGTVYGGEIELVSGGMDDNTEMLTFDGTEAWYKAVYTGGKSYFYLFLNVLYEPNAIMCSHFVCTPVVSGNTVIGLYLYVSGGRMRINVRTPNADDMTADDFKAWLAAQAAAGTPLQVLANRTEPQTYQLAGTTIPTHKGQNNVWADTGDVSVEFATAIAETEAQGLTQIVDGSFVPATMAINQLTKMLTASLDQ